MNRVQPTLIIPPMSKPSKGSAKPKPWVIPYTLYVAINRTCIHQSLDGNPKNPCNLNVHPIVVSSRDDSGNPIGDIKDALVLYSPKLIKSWLSYLAGIELFGAEVVATTVDKSGVARSVQNVKVINIPTESQVARICDQNPNLHAATLNQVVQILSNLLVYPPNVPEAYKLTPPLQVNRNGGALATSVTSPKNIAKNARLLSIGYNKMAINNPSDKDIWDRFCTSEQIRIKVVMDKNNSQGIPDKIIDSFNNEQSSLFNQHSMQSVSSLMSKVHLDGLESYVPIEGSNKTDMVNPAHYFMATQVVDKPKPKSKVEVAKRATKSDYSYIQRVIHSKTGHKIDIDAEMRSKNYDFLLDQVVYMENCLRSNPLTAFTWSNGRCVPIYSGESHMSQTSSHTQAPHIGTQARSHSNDVGSFHQAPYSQSGPRNIGVTDIGNIMSNAPPSARPFNIVQAASDNILRPANVPNISSPVVGTVTSIAVTHPSKPSSTTHTYTIGATHNVNANVPINLQMPISTAIPGMFKSNPVNGDATNTTSIGMNVMDDPNAFNIPNEDDASEEEEEREEGDGYSIYDNQDE
jgi:hypothetical protein